MIYIKSALNFLSINFLQKARHVPPTKLNPIDAYINYFFIIVNWEDPKLTWIAFLLFNFIFMLIIYYELKFYCILFQIILVKCLLCMFGLELELKEHKYVSFEEIKKTLKGIVVYLRAFRRESPTLYLLNVSILFMTLYSIGQSISGQLFLYIFISSLFFLMQFIKLIPVEYKIKIRKILTNLQNTQGVVAEAELIPYLSNKDFNEEKDGDLDSLLTDRTQDSLSSVFLSGITSMPSHLEADNVEGIEEEDLIPHVSFNAIEYSSDSSDSENKNIKFDAMHFNGSSDEDSNFASGLKFTDAVDSNILQNLSQSVGTGLYNIGANLITNVLQSTKQHETQQRQESDSDFEIIDSDEVDES